MSFEIVGCGLLFLLILKCMFLKRLSVVLVWEIVLLFLNFFCFEVFLKVFRVKFWFCRGWGYGAVREWVEIE